MTEKTHYRKAFNSPYLSSADIVEHTVLTVARVILEKDKSKKTSDSFNTAYFQEKFIREGEPLKPMILNATNSKTMAALCKSKFIDDWQNIPVTIYVDAGVRFGRDTVEGLRIAPDHPPKKKELLPSDSKRWDHAVASYQKNGNLDAVKKHMTVSAENEAKICGMT